jgi:PAS domain S-box-containing protein
MARTRILIIDDDPALRKILADILRFRGFEPLAAGNGAEGLALLGEAPVNLVLIDLGLPDISGIDLLKRVKADHPSTEVIVLTGNATLDSVIEATNSGAFSYLIKPYDMEQLLLNIRRAIEKQEAQEAARENNLRLKSMFDSQPSGIIVVDSESHTITDANPAAVRMIGAPREEIVGRVCHRFVCPAEKGHCPITDLGMKVESSDRELLNAKGETVPIVKSVVPMKMDGRECLIENFIDISERKRAEEALRESEEDLNRAQAVAQTGSWRLDVRRNELLWSDEVHRMFGIPKGTPMTYETFLDAVHADDRDFVDGMWRAALQGEPYECEHRIVVGGAVWWVSERAELEFDQEGILLGGFGTVQDITDRKRAEEERERLIHELQEALAKVKTLSGMLPICAGCKKIRDDKGYWNQLEDYISEHSEALFTHGLCPGCLEKAYVEVEEITKRKIKFD